MVSGTVTTDSACKHCSGPTSRINGRTLRQSPARGGLLKKADDKRWIQVCPTCERQDLFDDHRIALPFQSLDGVMRTVQDDATGAKGVLSMAGFSFTQHALGSAVALANREDDDAGSARSTAQIEAEAKQYRLTPSHQSALELSDAICEWGRGNRVFGNLHKRHGTTLGDKMNRWMRAALAADTDEAAIAPVSSTQEAGRPKNGVRD